MLAHGHDPEIVPDADSESCLNCGTLRIGPYCHDCGQHAHESHRSLRRLAVEGLRSATESDGPFLRTLRRLAFNPGGLTRDYLNGKRASQVPPVRLFLFALAVFLIAAERGIKVVIASPNPAQRAAMPEWVRRFSDFEQVHGLDFLHAMHRSAELFAVLTVPIAAILLKLIYFDRRAMTLYDHAITAAYSLSFQFVMLAIIVALPDSIDMLGWLPFFAICAHLFAQLRGVYGGSKPKTLLRMAALALCSALAYFILFASWVAVAALLAA